MRILVIVIALFTCYSQVKGQNHIPDMTIEKNFAAQVKSMDEFIARFNGDEINPILGTDSARSDNLIALFDYNMPHDGMSNDTFIKNIKEFIETIITTKSKLAINSKETYAEAKCLVNILGKNQHITFTMVREQNTKGNNKWAIANIKGLAHTGLYDEKRATISPVDHEVHFISLQDFFQENHEIVPSMRSNDKEIDEMSLFFGLCLGNAIKFQYVEELKFYFTEVPGYTFVVEEIGREGINSGWLITSFTKANSDNEK